MVDHGPTFGDVYADPSICRVRLDPNALIKKRYVGVLTVKHIQSRWRFNGDIAVRHFEYRAEKWRSVTLGRLSIELSSPCSALVTVARTTRIL
jgi:hypothetical protein